MTERLYFTDSYLTEFTARVTGVSADGLRVRLDRTAFYAESGGQPADAGTLNGIAVTDVQEVDGEIEHTLAAPLTAETATGRLDWVRRLDHMQQHSGQHLLSAVCEELYHFKTVSFHLGAGTSTIDLETPSITPEQIRSIELRANALACENRPVTVTFEDAAGAAGLRKASARTGELRIVDIAACDRSACGGTHVRATGEIGPVLIRKTEKIRGNTRVEFLCGARATARARADYDALAQLSRLFSATFDECPALAAAQNEQLKEAEKARRKLALELAERRGRELYDATEPDAAGRRVHVQQAARGAADDELRALAQSFAAQSGGVFLAVFAEPPAVLLAVAQDSGIHAGNRMKEALAAAGGRGGGSAQVAQGSVPDAVALEPLTATLLA